MIMINHDTISKTGSDVKFNFFFTTFRLLELAALLLEDPFIRNP